MDEKKLVDEYLESLHQQNKSLHTQISYRSDLARFIKWYRKSQSKPLNKLEAKDISAYEFFLKSGTVKILKTSGPIGRILYRLKIYSETRAEKLADSLGPNSQKRHLSTIKNFFEYLTQTQKQFIHNPVKSKVHHIKVKDIDIEHTKLLTRDDWNKLMNETLHFSDRVMLSVMYFAGLRISELKDLRVDQIDLRSKTLTFYRKGGELHRLPIPWSSQLFSDLTKYLSTRQIVSDYLVCRQDGRPYSLRSLHRHIQKLLLHAGCQAGLTPHSFRKACATNLYRRTKDLLKVRDFLNHKDAQVTQTYIEL